MAEMIKELLSQIPQVEKILQREDVIPSIEKQGRLIVTQIVKEILSEIRKDVQRKKIRGGSLNRRLEGIGKDVRERVAKLLDGSTSMVINGTGVIIHTNLGRAYLEENLFDRLKRSAAPYINLEYNLYQGKRGRRGSGLEKLLGYLFPGYSAHIVNNNAAAVLLLLNTISFRREVIVSRSELVEIGGSFRIPDIMAKSGARLKEVGTTNKTHLSDYEQAISKKTGLILKVHQSNFRIIGFTESVSIKELSSLAKEHTLPLMVDQGSGCIVDLRKYGIENEPMVQHILREGADVVCFSGDKLLGGPQAGIIIGQEKFINRVRKNPLSRALRTDKVTNALLENTLISFVKGKAFEEIPVLRMIALSKREISRRIRRFIEGAQKKLKGFYFESYDDFSAIGGGAAPMKTLPTKLLAICCENLSAEKLEKLLRENQPPVIGRVKDGKYLLDFRTIIPEQESILLEVLKNIRG